MEPKLVLTIILIITLIYFRFGRGSRVLKKKSHHYIVPPASQDDPNWIPIEINEYIKYIFFNQNSELDTTDEITKEIYKEFPQIEVEVMLENGWFQINVIHSNFSEFHKLISICTFIHGKNVIGYCKHKSTKSKDYIIKMDIDAGSEHLIGSFKTNQNFGIYLPKSDSDPKGNISKSQVKEIDFQYELNQIPSFV
jgi:hypothetical protein